MRACRLVFYCHTFFIRWKLPPPVKSRCNCRINDSLLNMIMAHSKLEPYYVQIDWCNVVTEKLGCHCHLGRLRTKISDMYGEFIHGNLFFYSSMVTNRGHQWRGTNKIRRL